MGYDGKNKLLTYFNKDRTQPVKNFNFMNGIVPAGLVLTRTGTGSIASYYNSSGLVSFAAANVGRFDYSPTTLKLNGLLMEPTSTNLALQSNSFSTTWSLGNSAAVTSASGTSPDGTNNAWSLVASSGFGYCQQGATVVSNSIYTASAYVKYVSDPYFTIGYRDGTSTNGVWCGFNIQTGTNYGTTVLGNGVSKGSGIQTLPNNWYRVWVSGTITATNGGIALGDEYNQPINPLIYGAQLELGQVPTAYIPTTTTSLTRGADSLASGTSPGWLNASSGTLMVQGEFRSLITGSSQAFADLDGTGGLATNSLLLAQNGTNAYAYMFSGGSETWNPTLLSGSVTAGTVYRMALSYKNGVYSAAATGGTKQTQNSGTLPTGLSKLYLGCYDTGGAEMNGWLQDAQYYNYAQSASQVAALVKLT